MLSGMMETDLKIIETDLGSVYHGLKNTDNGFEEFGEVYFSSVKKDKTKAWKLHKEMTLNLFVPIGSVQFCFVDDRKKSKTYNERFGIILSQNPYLRLTVPPGLWFGFRGISEGINFICNVADIPHDPNEVLRKELNEIEWSLI